MNPKLLTESGWKATAVKFKIKDNGLQRALAAYEKTEDHKHDELIKQIALAKQLAVNLKKAREVAAEEAAEEKKQEEDEKEEEDDEEEEDEEEEEEEEEEEGEGAYAVRLVSAFQKLK